MIDKQERQKNQQKMLLSPSYRVAYKDVDFLTSSELRHVRMELEQLKPELAFRANKITSTIVVFGSTQIIDPADARQQLERAKAQLADTPDDPRRQRDVARAERIAEKSQYYEIARNFGRLVSSSVPTDGQSRYVITTGGGPGIMEAANRGASETGAKSVGLNIRLPKEQKPNPFITPELCFQFHYFAIRKFHFILRAKALVVFLGGFGTLDELFDALTLRQTGRMQEIPIIIFGREYWDKVINFEQLADEGTIEDKDLDLFRFAETAEQAWQMIQGFHRKYG